MWAAVPAVLPREVAVLLRVVVVATGLMVAVWVAVWSE